MTPKGTLETPKLKILRKSVNLLKHKYLLCFQYIEPLRRHAFTALEPTKSTVCNNSQHFWTTRMEKYHKLPETAPQREPKIDQNSSKRDSWPHKGDLGTTWRALGHQNGVQVCQNGVPSPKISALGPQSDKFTHHNAQNPSTEPQHKDRGPAAEAKP